jgi:hypothetical protein
VTKKEILYEKKEAIHNMGLALILLVMATFLAAIFTAGYNDKPGTNK